MEIVNRLLRLQGPDGGKVVWTRFDVRKCLTLMARRMEQDR